MDLYFGLTCPTVHGGESFSNKPVEFFFFLKKNSLASPNEALSVTFYTVCLTQKWFISTHLRWKNFLSCSSDCGWTCREPPWSQVEQRGGGNIHAVGTWMTGGEERCKAGFLCCKGLVVSHPCRVGSYFHFVPLLPLMTSFTPVLMAFIVILDDFLNWEVISSKSQVPKASPPPSPNDLILWPWLVDERPCIWFTS